MKEWNSHQQEKCQKLFEKKELNFILQSKSPFSGVGDFEMEAMLGGMYGGLDDITERPKGYDKLICVPVGNVDWVGITIWVGEKVTSDCDVGMCG